MPAAAALSTMLLRTIASAVTWMPLSPLFQTRLRSMMFGAPLPFVW